MNNLLFSITDRLNFVRSLFKDKPFSRKDYQIELKNISNATASRDLQQGVQIGWLKKSGDKRTTTYVFN